MSRNGIGEGSIYKRRDGRWVGSAYVAITDGTRKRISLYGHSRGEVRAALTERLRIDRLGIRTPAKSWTVGAYTDYWLHEAAVARHRPSTHEGYVQLSRNHLGAIRDVPLAELTVPRLQQHMNALLESGVGPRTVDAARSLLRAVLSQAEREELVLRNVAKLVQVPHVRPDPIEPWTREETARFLEAARGHRWFAAFVLLFYLGLRRGEVLGLSWDDVDPLSGALRVHRQMQRIDGQLELAPLKTDASRRRLALVGLPAVAIAQHSQDSRSPLKLLFTSEIGTAVDPRNFGRVFHKIRTAAGLRRIKLHHARHTAATFLKDAGVSARDAQLILGHAHVTTTQQIYQHGDQNGHREALAKLERLLAPAPVAVKTAVTRKLSTGQSSKFAALTPGGASGARTHDTLLKRMLEVLDHNTLTSVERQLRTSANACWWGGVAVKNCCRSSRHSFESFYDLVAAQQILLESIDLTVLESRRPFEVHRDDN